MLKRYGLVEGIEHGEPVRPKMEPVTNGRYFKVSEVGAELGEWAIEHFEKLDTAAWFEFSKIIGRRI
jgi:hypothetical protein